MQEPNGNSPGAVGHIPEAREVGQRAELNMVFGNLQRGSMNDTFIQERIRKILYVPV